MLRSDDMARAAGLGLATGMRSLAPLAALSLAAYSGTFPLRRSPFNLLATRPAAIALTVMAAGELVADKLPMTPDRTDPLAWLARVGLGSLDGALVGVQAGRGEAVYAAIGGTAAAASTYLFHALRLEVDSQGVPDPLAGAVEDLLALSLTFAVTRLGMRRPTSLRDRLPW